MDEGHRITAVKWLSGHIDNVADLRGRVYTYEDEWDWNAGQIATDPILGIHLYWDKKKQCYVPIHEHLSEESH